MKKPWETNILIKNKVYHCYERKRGVGPNRHFHKERKIKKKNTLATQG